MKKIKDPSWMGRIDSDIKCGVTRALTGYKNNGKIIWISLKEIQYDESLRSRYQ